MFCSECGKTIDDEVLICPECGAVTKNGLLKLQDAAKQGEAVRDNVAFTAVKPKDKAKTLRLVAMILGLAGSAFLLSSLMGEFCNFSLPIIGKTTISVSNYLDKMTAFVFLLAGFSIVASFLRYAILQIITGSITGAWIGYLILAIKSRTSDTELKGFEGVNFGIGTYLFILAACLILASGIVYVVAANKSKSSAPAVEKGVAKHKKAEIIVSICLGVLFVCSFGIFVFIRYFQGTGEAKTAVGSFMNAAIHYEVDSMKSYLASDVNDKNGFMEAYTPDTMSNSFLSQMGISLSRLEAKDKKAITEASVLFGKNYLKKYDVGDVTKNSDGSFTVKVSASIIDMSTTSEQIQKKTTQRVEKFIDDFHQWYTYDDLLKIYGSEEEVALFIIRILSDDICKIINDAIKSAGTMETEFSFVVKKIDGKYKITEIDYKD